MGLLHSIVVAKNKHCCWFACHTETTPIIILEQIFGEVARNTTGCVLGGCKIIRPTVRIRSGDCGFWPFLVSVTQHLTSRMSYKRTYALYLEDKRQNFVAFKSWREGNNMQSVSRLVDVQRSPKQRFPAKQLTMTSILAKMVATDQLEGSLCWSLN